MVEAGFNMIHQQQLMRNGVDIGGYPHGRAPPSSAATMTTLLLCHPLPASLASSTPSPLLSRCPLPAHLAPPPLPPPSGHVVCRLPAAHKNCHRLVPASSFSSSPHLLSSNCPLPTLAAASMKTLLPPLSPQSPPCHQRKALILAKKATMFSMAVEHLLLLGTLWNHPPATLCLAAVAPTRWCGKGPLLAIGWLACQNLGSRMATYAAISPPTNQPTGQPTNFALRATAPSLHAVGINRQET
jgi:hypothetical protein